MSEKNFQTAFDHALRLLSRYPRTVHEIKTKLTQQKYQADTISQVVEELADTGQLDDQAYTVRWLEAQLQNRPCGRLLCYKKLRQRGIATELITESLDKHYPPAKEMELAQRAAQQKRASLATQDNKKNTKQKIAFYLKNKGFAGDVIYQVINAE